MSETSLQVKQQYLRKNIIEAGYDAQRFMEYCQQRHNLADLQNWSMKQLVQIVEDFIKSQSNTNYSASVDVKHQINVQNNPVTQAKLGLVLSDSDWDILLTGTSTLPNQSAQESKAPVFDFSAIETAFKSPDIPHSPPSVIAADKKQAENNLQMPQRPITVEPQNNEFKIQKPQKGSNSKENPINLSNLRLKTAKQKNLPALPNINQIKIIKTEQISKGFLQSDFTLYHIHMKPCNIFIQRKVADLRRLRNILQRLYPFLRIPYIQAEGWISSSQGKDPQTLSRYTWMVEQFLKFLIVESSQFKHSEIVRIFLGLGPKGDLPRQSIKKLLDLYDNISKPKLIQQVVLLQNTIQIPPTSINSNLVNNTLNLLNDFDLSYTKIQKQLDIVFDNYEALSKSFVDLGSTFENLQNLVKKYNMDNNLPRQVRIFDGLREITNKISHRLNQEQVMLKNRIKGLFKYQKQNMNTLKEVIEIRNKIHGEYSRYSSPSLSHSAQGGVMEIQSHVPLQEPVKNNKNILAVQEIFWSYTSTKQIMSYWQLLRRKIGQHLTLIAYDELDNENDNLNFWNSIIKRCVF